MIYKDIIQGSDEWKKLRIGVVTASRIIDIMPSIKTGKYNASRKNYLAEKAIEILTGEMADSFVSAPMQWGTDTEPLARSAFEAKTGKMVEEVGFVTHPNPALKNFGCSPDGLIGEFDGLEIKCPNSATHIEVLLQGKFKIKRDYIFQMQTCLMCTERDNWYFMTYDPRMPDNLSMAYFRFERDKTMIAEIEKEVLLFNAELDALIKKLREIE